jgi:hypothetical protein
MKKRAITPNKIYWTGKSYRFAQVHLVLIIPVEFGCVCTCSSLGVVRRSVVTDVRTNGQTEND